MRSGMSGSLQWGYHTAASLGPWTVTKDDVGVLLTAQVVNMDSFKVSQRPLKFVAPHAMGAWRWSVVTLEIQDAALTARLGPRC